ncbi:Hypothetical predicted protein [Pelobates cultripes]|uniref:Uncharacterized protein n=1 Tax=Pelobates cultripes TaxID=61616 RepID=A0AAD1VN34_PELCU|nr:Hypothetical predicted protein [Pelobates cultripes]
MLQELRTSMKADFQTEVTDIRKEMLEVGACVNALEVKADELCLANDAMMEKICRMEVDLEDRSRCNNIHVRGVPETIPSEELPNYLQQLFRAIQPSLEPADLMDRAQRVPKPKNLAQDVPRDIVTRLHYYSSKEAILTAQRKALTMPPSYDGISLYTDLSPTTMSRRRDFINITKCLCNHKLLIWRMRSLTKLEDPAHGMDKIRACFLRSR